MCPEITPKQWWFEVIGPKGKEYVQASQPLVDNAPKSFRNFQRHDPFEFYQNQMFRWVKPWCNNQDCHILNVVEAYGIKMFGKFWVVFSTLEEAHAFVERMHETFAESFI